MTAPNPPTFPESLRSNPDFPRPKPLPIITRKSLSVDALSNASGSAKESRVKSQRTHSKDKTRNDGKRDSKNKNITVKSPSDMSTDDLRNVPRPISADTMMDDSYLSLESYNFADDVVKMSHKVNPISFIDDGGKFVKYSEHQEKVSDNKLEIQSWEKLNLNLARNLQINRHTFLHIFQAYYAGLCLFSLFVFPFTGFHNGNDATISNPMFVFYAFYSDKALNTCYVFNFFVTLAALAACDIVLGERRTVSHRPFSPAFMVKFGIVVCCIISIISNAIMVGLDEELYASGVNDKFGGKFGGPEWFADKVKIDYAQDDFHLWNTLNTIRAFAGIINWILCSLCLDKTRYWSIVDPESRIQRDNN